MFEELGDRELDMSIYALEMLKVYKIQSINNDFNKEDNINLNKYDKEFMSYNDCYGQLEDELFENIILKISDKITIEQYSSTQLPFNIGSNDAELSQEDIEDILSNGHIVVIPVKSENPEAISKEFAKVVNPSGMFEECFDDFVFYYDDYIYILMDYTAAIEVLLCGDLVELLYNYKSCGVLLC